MGRRGWLQALSVGKVPAPRAQHPVGLLLLKSPHHRDLRHPVNAACDPAHATLAAGLRDPRIPPEAVLF